VYGFAFSLLSLPPFVGWATEVYFAYLSVFV
jgi:hypothetical protein